MRETRREAARIRKEIAQGVLEYEQARRADREDRHRTLQVRRCGTMLTEDEIRQCPELSIILSRYRRIVESERTRVFQAYAH